MRLHRLNIAILILGFFSLLPCAVLARVTVRELYYILERDGISNSLTPDTKIHSVGKIQLKGRWYSFFYFDHVTRETQHGLYRILVLNDRKRYIGGYMVQDSDNCRLGRLVLICDDDNGRPHVVLEFKNEKLPDRALIDGYVTEFEK